MGFAKYISETEAIQVCGVSASTLSRFAETGYLSVEREADGLALYNAEELSTVFGKEIPSATEKKASLPKQEESTQSGEESQTARVETPSPSESRKPELLRDQPKSAEKSAPDNNPKEQEKVIALPIEREKVSQATDKDPRDDLSDVYETKISNLEEELLRAKKVHEVNERIIEIREQEISQLRDERNWLRTRIERLEEKGERDQILLLSETQIVRQMIEQQESKKRSPIRAALNWLGMGPSSSQGSDDQLRRVGFKEKNSSTIVETENS
jgi:ubiquinone biosynthesis protein UbiJ